MVHKSCANEGQAASIGATLLRLAQPDLYRLNIFRVLNLSTRATERDIQKYLRKIQLEEKFGSVGAGVAPNGASFLLQLNPPAEAEIIAEAQSHLADAERRLISELFWFWPNKQIRSTRDQSPEPAASREVEAKLPSTTDFDTAASLWTRNLEGNGEERRVAAHNLAVLFHAAALDIEYSAGRETVISEEQKQRLAHYWSTAIRMWKRVLTDDYAWEYLKERVEELNDPRLKPETVSYLRLSLPVALLTINAGLAVRASQIQNTVEAKRQTELMRAFAFTSDVETKAREYVLEPVHRRIHDLCVTMGEDARNSPEEAMHIAERLFERSRPLLMAVDDLLPAGDPRRRDVLDAVALAANDAMIIKSESFSHGIKRDWQLAQEFLERISRYAATTAMRAHINKSLVWVRDNIRYSDHKSCWFCGEHEEVSEAVVTIRMYKMVAANHYNYYDVKVPRCLRCRAKHYWLNSLTALGAFAGAAVALMAYLTIQQSFALDQEGNGLYWAAFGCASFALIGGILAYRVAMKKFTGNLMPSQYKWRFPEVIELQSQQWTHNKPS